MTVSPHCTAYRRGDYASEEAGLGVARLLLERGADVNALSKNQTTPLRVASYNGKLEIARLLLDHDTGDTPWCTSGHCGRRRFHPIARGCVSKGDYASSLKKPALVLHGYYWSVALMSTHTVTLPRSQWTPLHVASYIWETWDRTATSRAWCESRRLHHASYNGLLNARAP
jgi:hypothetical protein